MLKKDSHFIDSPFKTVTEYESAFVTEFNNNLAGAVADVLKYVAKATAASINEISDKNVNGDLIEAEMKVEDNPTDSQINAGNYRKGHLVVNGLEVTIENAKGSVRNGVDNNGKTWSVVMKNPYGYFKRTKGKDGDHIDVFIGDDLESEKVFVVDQNINNKFDEHKVMLGFNDKNEAKKAYLSNYTAGWKGLSKITEVDLETFKTWLSEKTKKNKPFSEYKIIKDDIQ